MFKKNAKRNLTLQNFFSSGLLSGLAEAFMVNGDVCSQAYTNTPAAHSGPMRRFSSALQVHSSKLASAFHIIILCSNPIPLISILIAYTNMSLI